MTSDLTGQAPDTVDLLIVGAGFSGLIMAMEARRQGLTDIAILEKADEVGGTWRENTYPGIACDVPSHLYSIARNPNPDWSSAFAGGAEIQDYLRRTTREEDLYPLIHFGQKVETARWTGTVWEVRTAEGKVWLGRTLTLGMGPLHKPLIPRVPGIETFSGPSFHSAQWRHDVDLKGKRVAVVGTGASAVQFVPEIAPEVAQLTVFQRTPPYVLPRPDGPIGPMMRRLHRLFPPSRALRRSILFHLYEFRHAAFRGEERAVNWAMKMWRKGMEKAISDPDLRKALTPGYRIGCKRILSSNRWYRTLARENVTVIPDGLARIDGDRLVARNGTETQADVVIWGTGFHVTDALDGFEIRGEVGQSLSEAWACGMQAHLGVAMTGFPNLFFLLGPHTGLGHNSVVLMIEAQADHIARVLCDMRRRGLPAITPRADAQQAFEAEMDERLAASVWQAGGCTSWYQDDHGRNPTIWPGTVGEYQKRMHSAGPEQYRAVPLTEGVPS